MDDDFQLVARRQQIEGIRAIFVSPFFLWENRGFDRRIHLTRR
jgi:hypothetical protein